MWTMREKNLFTLWVYKYCYNLHYRSGPLTCDSQKVIYLLKCKVCGELPYCGRAKTKFRYRLNSYKSKHRAFRKGNRKVPQKLFHTHYYLDGHSGIKAWDFVIFQQHKTYAQLKGRETFWKHRRKHFYLIGLNEKEEYLYWRCFFFLRFQLNRNVVF